MKAVNTMIFNIDDTTYSIDDSVWNKHMEMHPVRPIDALKSSLHVVYGYRVYKQIEIETLINDEYNMSLKFGTTALQAEQIYADKYA